MPPCDAGATHLKCGELDEVERLEKLFEIPTFNDIIHDKKLRRTTLRWLAHLCEGSAVRDILRCAPAVPFRVMHLPHDFQDLFQRCIQKECPDCGRVIEEPILCLFCGKLCSETCCRESGSRTHAMSCGSGIGVFLVIRTIKILLLRSSREALWPSQYLDKFGEEDSGLKRGKPLFLDRESYATLTHMVARTGLDSSEVLKLHMNGIAGL